MDKNQGNPQITRAKRIFWIGIITIIAAGAAVSAYLVFVGEEVVDSDISTPVNQSNTNSQSQNIEWERASYASGQHSFSLDLPKTWEAIENTTNVEERASLLSASDEQYSRTFTVRYFNNPSQPLVDWVTEHKQELLQGHEDIIDAESDWAQEDRIIVAAEMKEVFKHMHCYIGGVGRVYEVYFFSELKDWEGSREIFNRACETFVNIDMSDWQTYENAAYGYLIQHPSNYTVRTTAEERIAFIEGDVEFAPFPMVRVSTSTTINGYLPNLMKEYSNPPSSNDEVVLGGRAGRMLVFPTDVGLDAVHYLVENDNTVYDISTLQATVNYQIFQAMVDSFRLVE